MSTRQYSLWIAWPLAGVTGALAALHLAAMTAGGQVAVGPLRLATVGAGLDRRAESLLRDKRPTDRNLAEAEQLSRLALREFPYDTSSWIRIAYIDHVRHGDLSSVGLAAFERSYDLIAVDPRLGPWRIHFALERWAKLPNNLRKSVRDEARAFATDGRGRQKLSAALSAVRNPDSAVMVTLWRQRYVVNASRIEHRTPEKAAQRSGY